MQKRGESCEAISHHISVPIQYFAFPSQGFMSLLFPYYNALNAGGSCAGEHLVVDSDQAWRTYQENRA